MIQNSIDRVQFTADGTATLFSCAPMETVDGVTLTIYDALGAVYTGGYSIIGVRQNYGAAQAANTFSLSFTTAPPAGVYTVVRDLGLTQPVELNDFAAWSPKAVEAQLDRATLDSIGLWDRLQRAIRAPIRESTPMAPMPGAADRAGRHLAFDAQGQPIVGSAAGGIGLVPQATTLEPGIVRLATIPESVALVEDQAVMTPARAPIASEIQRGFLRVATKAETDASALANAAVSPKNLGTFAGSKVSTKEITDGTATDIRRFSPADLRSFVAHHSAGGTGGFPRGPLWAESNLFQSLANGSSPVTGWTNVAADADLAVSSRGANILTVESRRVDNLQAIGLWIVTEVNGSDFSETFLPYGLSIDESGSGSAGSLNVGLNQRIGLKYVEDGDANKHLTFVAKTSIAFVPFNRFKIKVYPCLATVGASGGGGDDAAAWAEEGNTSPIPDTKLRRWHGTQAQYEALGSYDDDTLYLITDVDSHFGVQENLPTFRIGWLPSASAATAFNETSFTTDGAESSNLEATVSAPSTASSSGNYHFGLWLPDSEPTPSAVSVGVFPQSTADITWHTTPVDLTVSGVDGRYWYANAAIPPSTINGHTVRATFGNRVYSVTPSSKWAQTGNTDLVPTAKLGTNGAAGRFLRYDQKWAALTIPAGVKRLGSVDISIAESSPGSDTGIAFPDTVHDDDLYVLAVFGRNTEANTASLSFTGKAWKALTTSGGSRTHFVFRQGQSTGQYIVWRNANGNLNLSANGGDRVVTVSLYQTFIGG